MLYGIYKKYAQGNFKEWLTSFSLKVQGGTPILGY